MKILKKLVFVFILFSTTIFVGCKKDNVYSYQVSGTANNYDVTIEASPSGTAQYSNVVSGWKYTWTQSGQRFLYVSAQNNNDNGTVTVSIIKNSKVIATNTSSGAYVIATVDGTY